MSIGHFSHHTIRCTVKICKKKKLLRELGENETRERALIHRRVFRFGRIICKSIVWQVNGIGNMDNAWTLAFCS
jgi:hypothetical protein